MKLERVSTSVQLTLDDSLLWSDEFDWQGIEQSQEYAVNGALIVQEGKKLAGRSIELSADPQMGWLKRSSLSTLKDWSLLQDETFKLIFEYPHDTREFDVIFNHARTAIEANPVKGHPTVSDDDYYRVTLRFIEIGV